MFEVSPIQAGQVELKGRLDAAQAARAETLFERLVGAEVLDLSALEYISSAGLGLLLKLHKQKMAVGDGLRLVEVSPHIADILHYSGFDKLFDVMPAAK
ncbi:MAG: STAS domain-containing protein [Halioglobus sp.]